jgi:hypothetical protein
VIADLEHPDWCERQLLCDAHKQGGRHASAPWVVHDLNGSTGTIWLEQSPGGAVLVLSRVDGALSRTNLERFERVLARTRAEVAGSDVRAFR